MRERILTASAGRDRVTDAVKALALALVILGHNLAWTTLPDGTAVNTLDEAPALYPLTWTLQILPLFFVLAGAGLTRYAAHPDSAATYRRIDRLTTPTLPLLATSLVAAAVLTATAGPAIGTAAGILPVQLTWFLGVYLLVVASAPLLRRLSAPWQFAAMLTAILTVDIARVHANPQLGWINLLLVWSYFTAIGMHLPRLRALPRTTVATAGTAAAVLAVLAVAAGPYSPALITTTALPGLSNLAPPTVVLALAGTAQIAVLLLAWPALQRLLAHDRVWIPVAVFSFRAMGLYLWHMLLLSAAVAAALAAHLAPPALSAAWWTLHAVVLAAVTGGVWLLAPPLLKLASAAADAAARLVPAPLAAAATRARPRTVTALAALAGVCLLTVSESGLADPLHARTVAGIPYIPAAALLILLAGVAVARRTQPRRQPEPARPGDPAG